MASQGLINAMASQDYDSFLFGCPNVIRNLGVSQRRKLPNQQRFIDVPTEQIAFTDMLTELQLKDRTQLILLGLLVGTDYNPKGIKGIGPKTALKLVKQYPSISALLIHLEKKYTLDEVFPFPPTVEFTAMGTIELGGEKNIEQSIREKLNAAYSGIGRGLTPPPPTSANAEAMAGQATVRTGRVYSVSADQAVRGPGRNKPRDVL